ncbi:phosphomevalonate kinase isoform X5 [Schistocerca piceifrons]|uniref:phosphomevalonate kinase isoform X5 n=1 Tax=Schistocerca piceifrons TaxID=274613 RepID=UPI001F5ED8AA|nr:phosphomevalonate kinase isoform X5 [Schistocerca piceifrons]
MADSMSNPRCVLLFSGKRKSGKDYIVENLLRRLKPNDAVVLRLSAPIKKYWAESKGLDFDQLLGTGAYKENYRLEMIRWGESVRARDPGYFCQRAIEMSNGTQFSVWIVSDTRRLSDLKWFLDNCGGPSVVHTVRVVADDAVRKQRGWMYTPGIDDAVSECGLDSITDWNWTISNNGKGTEEIEAILQNIVQWVNSATSVTR